MSPIKEEELGTWTDEANQVHKEGEEHEKELSSEDPK